MATKSKGIDRKRNLEEMKNKIIILVIAIIIGVLLFLSIDTSTEVIDDAWKLDGVILMQNTETGEIDCFGCNEVVCRHAANPHFRGRASYISISGVS